MQAELMQTAPKTTDLPAIQLQHVGVTFGDVVAIQNLSRCPYPPCSR